MKGGIVPRAKDLHRRQTGRDAGLVDVSSNAFFERTRHEIDFANQACAILIVDQRSASAHSETDPRIRQPFPDDVRQLGGSDTTAAAIVSEVPKLRLEREAHELLSTVVLVNPSVACFRIERQRNGLADSRLRGEMLRPHDGAALASVAEDDGRPGTNDVGGLSLDVTAAHVLVEKLHNCVGEGVGRWIAEVAFHDGAVAKGSLRGTVDSFAAGENQAGKFPMHGGFEHVSHSENVDARRERGVVVDERPHDVSEMDDMGRVRILLENGHYVTEVADIQGDDVKS